MRRNNLNVPPPLSPSAFDIPVGTEVPFPPQSRGRTANNDFSHPYPYPYSCSSSASPLSSAATSPASSPTSPFRRIYRGLSSSRSDGDATRSRSQSPFSLHSVLRARPSLILLRRRPSSVDIALSEERYRCDEDSVERQGLELLEPRPVDPVDIPMDLNSHISGSNSIKAALSSGSSSPTRQTQSQSQSQPRFVMGGIVEVMEGQA
ncbi:hypothetical protein MPDQ_000299 [Monascus purpureus]|uniref:Uncharacterized protein n=1 Tax=Monascus purpureus TaxID=5098 RepID=A0A507QU35_MONPU|nr:hypothetical protein MPDQ_000299 [Monascus purpureus]BDD54692.1 hypothetical protein MAP00_000289 [Monascus purpureus]